MNKTPHITHGQGGNWKIIDLEIRDNPNLPKKGKEYEPELDVDLEIIEIGEADPTIEQEKERKRIGEIIGNENVGDLVDDHTENPGWGPKPVIPREN